ncbi:hypothetical protein [Pseudomonas sp. FP1742]|uniref:hypothetical protein n=1 Tax=Pseudomonas sp. FP1742 TaxID=2954079 RepID=UPI0027368C9A|nr:hypothetical protein [Pseudomonas sp. FP1742]WLG48652.1 hypothetical protein PSH64_18125 [Pseudomonas sp. FP1742]
MTRLQTLKLIQIAIALPAYAVPASVTVFFTLWFVITLPISLITSQSTTNWEKILLWLVLSLFSQWTCWSIFADALEDIPSVRHLPLLLLGVLLTLLLGVSAWTLFHIGLIWLICGSQGIAACVLLTINWVRKKRHADCMRCD